MNKKVGITGRINSTTNAEQEDLFRQNKDGVLSRSAVGGVNVAAGSDTTTYEPPLMGFYVGSTGDVEIVDGKGVTLLFAGVPTGAKIDIECKKIMATNTTASQIIGLL